MRRRRGGGFRCAARDGFTFTGQGRPGVWGGTGLRVRRKDRLNAMAKFRLQRLRGGRKHIIQTDSAADYLRCLIDEMAGDFNVLCHVSVTERVAAERSAAERSVGTGWMHVKIESAPEAALLDRASEFRFGEFADELHHVFNAFYESEAVAVDAQGRAWNVRHRRGCPWI